jgi:AraC-like DNA-binding protein
MSGTFQYRTSSGQAFMTPGSLLLGNAGDCFSCGHEHGTGDRCIAFSYAPEFLDQVANDLAAPGIRCFTTPRLAPRRELSPLVAKTAAILFADAHDADFESLALRLVASAMRFGSGGSTPRPLYTEASSVRRVAQVVRSIDAGEAGAPTELAALARIAGLSPYHFLRTFMEVTGSTPHQYLLRLRLRRAALLLKTGSRKIVEIAFDCGFGDLSNFNRAFRSEFGVSPRVYRATA